VSAGVMASGDCGAVQRTGRRQRGKTVMLHTRQGVPFPSLRLAQQYREAAGAMEAVEIVGLTDICG
jgi:hypothetical protein